MKRSIAAIALAGLTCCLAFALTGCSSTGAYEGKELTPTIDTSTLVNDGYLTVGVDASKSPYAGTVSGEIVGLDVDIAAAIADDLGLKLKVVDAAGDTACLAGDTKTCDIMMGATADDASDTVSLSDAYLQTSIVLFASSSDAEIPATDSGVKIAAQSSSMSAWEVENQYGEDSVVASNDLLSAFSSVETGAAEYVASDAIVGIYAARSQNVDVSLIAGLEEPSDYYIATSVDNADLLTAVNTAVAHINDSGIKTLIEKKWLGMAIDLSGVPLVSESASE